MTIPCLISSDDHVIESPDLWAARVRGAHADRVPRVVAFDDADYWVVDGRKTGSFSAGLQPGQRFIDPSNLKSVGRFSDVRPGAVDAAAHVVDNESDGIVAAVIYPTLGLSLFRSIADSSLLTTVCRAYNDWLVDYCSVDPVHLRGVAMMNVDDPEEAAGELRRAKEHGLVGAFIPTALPVGTTYADPEFDVFWSAAQELATPISLHFGAVRAGAANSDAEFTTATLTRTYFITVEDYAKASLADMLFSGLFDRFPKLRVGSIEHELGWIPHFLDRLDYTYTQRQGNHMFPKLKDGMLPSDHFRRNIFCSFQEDALGITYRRTIGLEGLMFGSDYPHTESTYPKSREIMAARLEGVPEEEQRLIVFDNVNNLYGLGVDRSVWEEAEANGTVEGRTASRRTGTT
jgi:predicted TIM-barrel fold metal-dependent hydrolase